MENKKSHEPTLDELDELLNGEANYKNTLECAHILRDEITALKNKADGRLRSRLENAELIETTELMEITELMETINGINKLLAFGIKIQMTIIKTGHQIKNNEFYVGMIDFLKRANEKLKVLKEKYESIGRPHNDAPKGNTTDGFDFDDI